MADATAVHTEATCSRFDIPWCIFARSSGVNGGCACRVGHGEDLRRYRDAARTAPRSFRRGAPSPTLPKRLLIRPARLRWRRELALLDQLLGSSRVVVKGGSRYFAQLLVDGPQHVEPQDLGVQDVDDKGIERPGE